MKAFVRKLCFVLLSLFIATPVMASSFDIAGDWEIAFGPKGPVELGGETLTFPNMVVNFTITENGDEGTYTIVSEEISALGGISFNAQGQLFGGTFLRMPGTDGSPVITSDLVGGAGQDLLLDLRYFDFDSEGGLKGDIYVLDLDDNLGGRVCGVGNRSAVPVPSAVWLLGSGVIALFVRRRSTNA